MPLSESLVRALRAVLSAERAREYEPMSAHCSFRIGGPARLFCLPADEDEAAKLLKLMYGEGVRPVVIGSGTNLLVPDGGLDAVVLCTAAMDGVSAAGGELRAGAGCPMARAAAAAQRAQLAGLEFAHGIPGSVGGGVFMNAGAYGGEMKDVLASARVLSPDGSAETMGAEELGLSYRRSALEGSGRVLTGAVFRLRPDSGAEIAARMRALAEKRRASQPLEWPSAGSTFKRPQGGYAAAMIDQAGLKGLAVGGAKVSEKHAGFIINAGGATYADVTALIAEVQRRVFERFGVMLEPEVRILGPEG
ncbi:MAG TPA: UDP-N-acetylmuramate dehydrogenase [Candidatus Scatomorpha stercorigallinarum]|nr:UDP-N-acetylmuramate dehydrogenase [Candidatus Scatomorpha stercorigallinarum]